MKFLKSLFCLCALIACSEGEYQSDRPILEFRSGVMLEPSYLTEVDDKLLDERDGFATTLTDPQGRTWEASTASGLTERDFESNDAFATHGVDGTIFHHRKTANENGPPDCAVYIRAGEGHYLTLRRGVDQGECPTTEDYTNWLPAVSMKKDSATASTLDTKEGALAFGAKTGSFNGVDSFSNNYPEYYCPDFKGMSACLSYVGSNVAGVKWQCVEYADRYYLAYYNHTSLWKGHAKYWYTYATNYGLKKFANCGATAPKVGDMLVSTSGSFGHIAIVRSVGSSSISVIQQNWFENEKDNNHTISMNTSGGKYCVSGFGSSSYPVAGWVRK